MSKYLKNILSFIFLLIFSVNITASSITAYLELILSEDGQLINTPKNVTLSLYGPDSNLRWTETHTDITFYKGKCSFQFGTISKIIPLWFYDTGIKFTVQIENNTVQLPIHSIPFSFFSHAADIVNSIHMDGLFHTDLINKRVGINIQHPTPSVRLEVNGAIHIGNFESTERGSIRFNNSRLEGFHNDGWKLLDVSDKDGFQSKWEENTTIPAFYNLTDSVLIGTSNPLAKLTVDGSGYIDQSIKSYGKLHAYGQLIKQNNYGISSNGIITARSVKIDSENYYDTTNGLSISGTFSGDGSGIYNINSINIKDNAIQSNEISDLVFESTHFSNESISGDKIAENAIQRPHLFNNFKLSNHHLNPQIITDNHITRHSISDSNLATNFALTLYAFKNGSIISTNIGINEVDTILINTHELKSNDFSDLVISSTELISTNSIKGYHFVKNSIQFNDFKPNTLSHNHLNNIVSINHGGTDQTTYGNIGELIIISNNQFISEPNFILKNNSFGIHNPQPTHYLDIKIPASNPSLIPIEVNTNSNSDAKIAIENIISQWAIQINGFANLMIKNNTNTFEQNNIEIDQTNGHIGISTTPKSELLSVSEGIHLGNKTIPTANLKPGTIYYSDNDNKFKFVVAANTIESLAAHIYDNPIKNSSYLFTNMINNNAEKSRILLGKNTTIYGKNNTLLGSTDSYISGKNNLIKQTINSTINGVNLTAEQNLSSHLFGTFSTLSFSQNTISMGNNLDGKFLISSSTMGGNNHTIHSNSSSIQGNSNIATHISKSTIFGNNNSQHHLINTTINGNNLITQHTKDFSINGNNNIINNSYSSVINGSHNIISHINATSLSGKNNIVFGSDHATIIGKNNVINFGNGIYLGDNNQHLGTGAPTIIGQSNLIIGKQNNTFKGDHIISIGTAETNNTILNDNAILLHAPGGLDIISGEFTLAHLGKNQGSWSHISDKNSKTNITNINPEKILDQTLKLPLTEWRYKGQYYTQHIGPVAQEFFKLFNLGSSDRYIQSVDIDGVILSSIQGLSYKLKPIQANHYKLEKNIGEINIKTEKFSENIHNLTLSKNNIININDKITHQLSKLQKKEKYQFKKLKQLTQRISKTKLLLENQND